MDLLEDDGPAGGGNNTPEFSVAELSGAVKRTLEATFGRVRVRGEIGRVMHARSGHLYYTLKDDRNALDCTTWKGQVRSLGVMPEEGLEVIVTGKLSGYGPQSKYNMNVDSMEVAGEGALMAMLEKRRKALAAEGLFDAERKQTLPFLPEVIGVVTSPQGAVIRDILHRLRDRFPRKVLVWPVPVQGPDCAPKVAAAIHGFNAFTQGGALPRPDLLIVARGGGSVEDLWGFNEEAVVRAAAESAIPLISAVGHETDTTLIDHASDRRAPTPTAAAEMAVPVRADLLAHIETLGARASRALGAAQNQRGQRLRDLSRGLPRAESLLDIPAQRLDALDRRLPAALSARVARDQVRLGQAAGALRPSALERATQGQAEQLRTRSERAQRAAGRLVRLAATQFQQLSARLSPTPLDRQVQMQRQALDQMAGRLETVQRQHLRDATARLAALGRMVDTLSYTATLARGFAVVRGADGILTSASAARAAGTFEIEFAGRETVPAQSLSAAPRPRARPKRSEPDRDDGQGSLL